MKKVVMVLLLVAAAACDSSRGMETRTFELARMDNRDAMDLLTPYIRDGGRLSGKDRLITVREKPDRLRLIEELLKKYDGGGEARDVLLKMQVIEADGFAQHDSAIADVEETLRQTFKYSGYKLIGETLVRSREGAHFRNAGNGFTVSGMVERVRGEQAEQRMVVQVALEVAGKASLESTVTGTIGKPLVLGQSTKTGAIILVVRPTLAGT